jgi:hypothetical protein
VFKSFITAEIRRYRIRCTCDIVFEEVKANFKKRLEARGYLLDTLKPLFDINFSRETLMHRVRESLVDKTHTTTDKGSVFVALHSPRHKQLDLKECLQVPNHILYNDWMTKNTLLQSFPLVAKKNPTNMGQLATKAKFTQMDVEHFINEKNSFNT